MARKKSKHPPFSAIRHGQWYFRFALPEDVKLNFGWTAERKGRPEINKPLGIAYTGTKEEELQVAAICAEMALEVKKQIKAARRDNLIRGVCENYSGGELAPIGPALHALVARPRDEQRYAGLLAGRIIDATPQLRAELGNLANHAELNSPIKTGAPQSAIVAYTRPTTRQAPKAAPGEIATFEDSWKLWLEREKNKEGQEGALDAERIKWYRRRFERFISPHIGELAPHDVHDAMDELWMKRKPEGASAESHWQDVTAINRVLTFIREKTNYPHPIRLADVPKRPKTRHATITWEQYPIAVEHIRQSGDEWFLVYTRLDRLLGTRPCELNEIQLGNFGAFFPCPGRDHTFVLIPGVKARGGKRTPRPFFVHGDAEVAELLDIVETIRRLHPTPDDRNALVFGKKGWVKPFTEWHRRFHAVLVELDALNPGQGWLVDEFGDNVTLNSLRHFFMTDRLLEHGDSPEHVARICGTSVKEIEDHYDHVTQLQWWKKYLAQKTVKAA